MTDSASLTYTVISCIAVMALVAWISWLKTRGSVETKDGYFLAGRGLGATFIAGSLLLTNLSAEQLIGLNGSAYGYNLSSMVSPSSSEMSKFYTHFLIKKTAI